MIFSGDFTQLPPVSEHELYSRKVMLQHSRGQGSTEQENTIGKLIWHQFTTVVMLKENMRQKETASLDEEGFRRVLVNLRYNACTAADKALLWSQIPALNPTLSIDDDDFRSVSIITAENRDKDEFNEVNLLRSCE